MTMPKELHFQFKKVLPQVLSAEAAECGLACMVMIGRYHGHDVDLNGLRQRFTVSMAGTTLRSIMTLADNLGFSTRALKIDIDLLRSIKTPSILHWNLNHFVVLKSASKHEIIVHDPARGVMKYSMKEASNYFTGIALEVYPAHNFEIVEAKAPIKLNSLWQQLYGIKTAAIFVLILSVALQLVAFALPFQMQLVVDDAIGDNDVNLLTVIALGFGGLTILQACLSALRDWTVTIVGSQIAFQMTGNLLRHLLKLPSSFFEKRHVGDILSRLGSVGAIKDALTQGIISSIIDGIVAIVAGSILFIYDPKLAFVVVISIFALLAVNLAYYPVMRWRTQEMIHSSAILQSHLMETVRGATVIKLLGRESERESAWRNIFSKNFNLSVSLGRFQLSAGFIQSAIVGLQSIAVIYLGARSILLGEGFSVGMLTAFLSFRSTFTDRVQSLISKAVQFRMLGLHLERLGDIVAQEPEEKHGPPTPVVVDGSIAIQAASFRYGTTDRWIFQNLNFEAGAGDFVAIVGPSGGGKTTLLKLLLGLQVPESGVVLLDGQPARADIWRSWRSQIGVISQDDRLLSGTIAENIAFFDPDLDIELVKSAACAAQIDGDIDRMPMKYLTLVGDMGSILSGGQRQRILLARALYRKPKILFLDEGTANLDPATEAGIVKLIAEMPITRIVVAHRPALVKRASKVYLVAGAQANLLEADADRLSLNGVDDYFPTKVRVNNN